MKGNIKEIKEYLHGYALGLACRDAECIE